MLKKGVFSTSHNYYWSSKTWDLVEKKNKKAATKEAAAEVKKGNRKDFSRKNLQLEQERTKKAAASRSESVNGFGRGLGEFLTTAAAGEEPLTTAAAGQEPAGGEEEAAPETAVEEEEVAPEEAGGRGSSRQPQRIHSRGRCSISPSRGESRGGSRRSSSQQQPRDY